MFPLKNLNEYQIKRDSELWPYHKFEDNSIIGENGVSVYFRNLEEKLIGHIKEANSVFGAVAWLTSAPILEAMSDKEHVQIIVQKEEFLKPDSKINNKADFKLKLRELYSKLKCAIFRGEFEKWLLSLTIMCSEGNSDNIEPVRCVGANNKNKKSAFPRMHNKFLIFANVEVVDDQGYPVNVIKPYAVWTGSFNFSYNATNSLENAVYITDKNIVDAYFKEYSQIATMSEPLDWSKDWVSPEWVLG